MRGARWHELLRAQQQRRDVIGLLEEARRAVGIFIAAEDDGQKILFHLLAAAALLDGMQDIVLGEIFLRQLHVGGIGDKGAAALHRRLFTLAGQQDDASILAV